MKDKAYRVQTIIELHEIAGFEYPQNFSKLFKKKVGVSPTQFRVA